MGLKRAGELDEVFDDSGERIGLLPGEAVGGIGDGNHAATRDSRDGIFSDGAEFFVLGSGEPEDGAGDFGQIGAKVELPAQAPVAEAAGDLGTLLAGRVLKCPRDSMRRGKEWLLVPMLEKCFPVFFRELGPFLVPGFPFLVTVGDAGVGGNNNGTPPFFGIEEQGMEGNTPAHGITHEEVAVTGLFGDESSGFAKGHLFIGFEE